MAAFDMMNSPLSVPLSYSVFFFSLLPESVRNNTVHGSGKSLTGKVAKEKEREPSRHRKASADEEMQKRRIQRQFDGVIVLVILVLLLVYLQT